MNEKDLENAAKQAAAGAARRAIRYVRPKIRSINVPMLAPGSAPCDPAANCNPAYCDPPPWGGCGPK